MRYNAGFLRNSYVLSGCVLLVVSVRLFFLIERRKTYLHLSYYFSKAPFVARASVGFPGEAELTSFAELLQRLLGSPVCGCSGVCTYGRILVHYSTCITTIWSCRRLFHCWPSPLRHGLPRSGISISSFHTRCLQQCFAYSKCSINGT